MSNFHSDKCSPEELKQFKNEVVEWLVSVGITKIRYRALRCYNGEVRIYTGENMEIQNSRSSFRRTEADRNDKGEIIGYTGTRGKHTRIYIDYAVINRDDFERLKEEWMDKDSFDTDVEKLRKLVIVDNSQNIKKP